MTRYKITVTVRADGARYTDPGKRLSTCVDAFDEQHALSSVRMPRGNVSDVTVKALG